MAYFLGMDILYFEKNIILYQQKYELELLKRFELKKCKCAVTLAEMDHKLDSDDEGGDIDATTFKQILRYIKRTLKFEVLFPFGTKSESELMCYSNSDWFGDRVDRRRNSRYFFKYLRSLISWFSKKQPVVALSTCEVEYIAGSEDQGDEACEVDD
ncbi:secreted RxLR effector protein 161-like [Vicia villosa]|uniref:secreted RxLR effector protein 161-like n=1 Tax=Vicia villosa TaxID=3911 RepID=UPI00273B8FBC|nr:secreted RxLR effector protein 161-like [Vicia villosa]